jgi:DNA invertase Pin-like site-specific DNA recombinase
MEKYIAYYRVSTNRQSLGLDAQRNSVLRFINEDSNKILINEYNEKESGKNNNRTELTKAINECMCKNAILVISKLDRLSRNISFIFQLRDSGIKFISLDIPTFNTLSLGIYASMAQSERELCSRRTKEALEVKRMQGIKLGRPNAHFSKEQILNASIVRKEIADKNENNLRAKLMIKSLLASTINNSEIARILNQNGFRTSKGMLFTSKQVYRIIERYGLGK